MIFEKESFLFFFGKKSDTLESIQQKYPQYRFPNIKQVHGNTVFIQPDNEGEADGHVTQQKNLSLKIVTADCVPVLLACTKSQIIGACHAGWRGLTKHIIKETISKMTQLGASSKDIIAYIGPHIRKDSFEVHLDVADQLLQCANGNKDILQTHSDSKKSYLDLNLVAHIQLEQFGIQSKNIHDVTDCTFKDKSYASFRRDGTGAGRQVSFVVKI